MNTKVERERLIMEALQKEHERLLAIRGEKTARIKAAVVFGKPLELQTAGQVFGQCLHNMQAASFLNEHPEIRVLAVTIGANPDIYDQNAVVIADYIGHKKAIREIDVKLKEIKEAMFLQNITLEAAEAEEAHARCTTIIKSFTDGLREAGLI